jgi:DNA invertase Pin-like site-specific DNA recombinase
MLLQEFDPPCNRRTNLDRLGRSVKGLVDIVNDLEARKVHFQSITDGVDTKTPAGRFFFHVMASLAQV